MRNHIKIEQQLKLHIECIQDKLDDTEKLAKKYAHAGEEIKEVRVDLSKYKDACKQKDLEIEQLKRQVGNYKQHEIQMANRL